MVAAAPHSPGANGPARGEVEGWPFRFLGGVVTLQFPPYAHTTPQKVARSANRRSVTLLPFPDSGEVCEEYR